MTIADPYSLPIAEIDMSKGELYASGAHWEYFRRLRAEEPVHYCADSKFGPFWSITRYEDIMYVDKNHELFSSEPTIVIGDQDPDFTVEQFISMDPPVHDEQRKAVQGVVAPRNLAVLQDEIRTRACSILDELPVGETFDWVERVSIELTTQMLASLFDFPFEDRAKLTFWSDIAGGTPELTGSSAYTEDERRAALMECLEYFTKLWDERVGKSSGDRLDFISAMAHSPAMQNMSPMQYLGNLILLIIGGNDTTRNSITGGVLALNEHPQEYAKLRADASLIPNMVSEIIRWQTPLSHMRRLATQDTELGGKLIRKGDKVVMWYISGNRDELAIDRPDEFLIDRASARQHMSFGYGIHRCMGNRLGEMQLRIVWEEILRRFSNVEVVGEPVRIQSNFVHGFSRLPVRLSVH